MYKGEKNVWASTWFFTFFKAVFQQKVCRLLIWDRSLDKRLTHLASGDLMGTVPHDLSLPSTWWALGWCGWWEPQQSSSSGSPGLEHSPLSCFLARGCWSVRCFTLVLQVLHRGFSLSLGSLVLHNDSVPHLLDLISSRNTPCRNTPWLPFPLFL